MAVRKCISTGLLALALLGLPTAWGLVLYQTQTWKLSEQDNGSGGPPYQWESSIDYNLDEFDGLEFDVFSNNSLPFRRVELILSGWYSGTAGVTNDDATAADVTLSLTGEQKLSIVDFLGNPVLSLTPNLSTVVSAPGNATTNFGLATPPATATKVYAGLEVEDFRGNPSETVTFLLFLAKHIFDANPLEAGKQITGNYSGFVFSEVTLKYYVPEPGSGVVLGLAALAMLRRRRR